MSTWSSGYVADVGYTYGYYQELNPIRCLPMLLSAGLEAPAFETACELGFGQGMSVNIHAAGSKTHWWGTDFNPSQAAFSQELARGSGAHCAVYDQSFADFCHRSDLPDFDFIGLHGIWSWISAANREVIVDFVRRKLKVGGVLYVSYNTLPGWSRMLSLRHLFAEHAERLSPKAHGIVSKVAASLEFAQTLLPLAPAYTQSLAGLDDRLNKTVGLNKSYLAHEYFNKDWLPMHFSEMASILEPAKVSYACSASPLDHVESINLNAEQLALLSKIEDPVFQQLTRDFMVNQQFRRDYWVKGPRSLTRQEQYRRILDLKVVLTTPSEEIGFEVRGALGSGKLQGPIYSALLTGLANHKVHSLNDLLSSLNTKKKDNVTMAQLFQAVIVLLGKGDISVAQDEATAKEAGGSTKRLNRVLREKAISRSDISYLASPVTGGGVAVQRFHQLFMHAESLGKKTPEQWARFAWETLLEQGQRVMKEGKLLEDANANIDELEKQAKDFDKKKMPLYKALQVV